MNSLTASATPDKSGVEIVEVVESTGGDVDPRVQAAAADFKSRVPLEKELAVVIGEIIRDAVDYVIDAPVMRRYSINDLEPDEKTTIGKRIERLIRSRLQLSKGEKKLDIRLAGEDVDIKTTCTTSRSWMFSKNSVGHVNLLIAYDESTALFDLGFVLASKENLGAKNRDKKHRLNQSAPKKQNPLADIKVAARIEWVLQNKSYPRNFLAGMSPGVLDEIVSARYGAERVRRLLLSATERAIPRRAIEAVANQKDPVRRTRGPDGARGKLWNKYGLLVLAGAIPRDKAIARKVLGIDLQGDEFASVSARTRT